MDVLKHLFFDKVIEDHRQPVAIFNFPGGHGETYGLYMPGLTLWIQLLVLLLIQTAMQCTMAVINYRLIVKRRGTPSAFLLGYGVVLPAAFLMPYAVIDWLDIRNKVLRFSFNAFSTLVGFRTIEAMHGTSPDIVESTMGTYVIYYKSLLHFEWDPKSLKRRQIKSKELISVVVKILQSYLLSSLMLSVLLNTDFKPFASSVPWDNFQLSLSLLSFGHLANCYSVALLTFFIFSFGFGVTGFLENSAGYYTKPVFDNPLLSSRSPSEFWSRKWNLMIHRILRHGVFLPAKTYFSTRVSIFLTFIASGLLHDYCWSLVFYRTKGMVDEKSNICEGCYESEIMKVTAFFLWNAFVMLLERKLQPCFSWTNKLPSALVSTLVVMSALPVSHWYTGDLVLGGYYNDFTSGMLIVRQVSSA